MFEAKNTEFFGLTNDIMFYTVFGTKGNEKLLICLLNALLEYEDQNTIEEIEILNPFILPKLPTGKKIILDISAKDRSGKRFNIEMQKQVHKGFLKRVLYYASSNFANQILRGDQYTELNKAVSLWILGENLTEEPEIHNAYLLKNTKSNAILTDLLELHMVELKKYITKERNQMTRFEKWLHILKYSNHYQDLKQLPDELKSETGIQGVIDIMLNVNANADEETRNMMRYIEKGELEWKLTMAECRKEGRLEEKLEMIKNLLKLSISVSDISKASNLSIDEILKIKAQLAN